MFTILSAASTQGTGLLTTLHALTDGMVAYLRSAEGARAPNQIFSGLGAVASALLPLLVEVARVAGAVLAPAIAQLGPMVAAGLGVLTWSTCSGLWRQLRVMACTGVVVMGRSGIERHDCKEWLVRRCRRAGPSGSSR